MGSFQITQCFHKMTGDSTQVARSSNSRIALSMTIPVIPFTVAMQIGRPTGQVSQQNFMNKLTTAFCTTLFPNKVILIFSLHFSCRTDHKKY